MTSLARLKNLPLKRGELTSTLRPTVQMGVQVGWNHPWVDCGGLVGWTGNLKQRRPAPDFLFRRPVSSFFLLTLFHLSTHLPVSHLAHPTQRQSPRPSTTSLDICPPDNAYPTWRRPRFCWSAQRVKPEVPLPTVSLKMAPLYDFYPQGPFHGNPYLATADPVLFPFHRTFMPLSAPFPSTSLPFRSSRNEEFKFAKVT
jgi:hypothetical protein